MELEAHQGDDMLGERSHWKKPLVLVGGIAVGLLTGYALRVPDAQGLSCDEGPLSERLEPLSAEAPASLDDWTADAVYLEHWSPALTYGELSWTLEREQP